MATVLIIEDEPELVKVLSAYLEKAGIDVLSALRGDIGYTIWEQKRPDLVILDLNLPGKDGLELARDIRRKSNTPILMLTARVDEKEQLFGLEIGADDYLTKPFSPNVVVAHVKALLRRSGMSDKEESKIIRIATLEINLDYHTTFLNNKNVEHLHVYNFLNLLRVKLMKAMSVQWMYT